MGKASVNVIDDLSNLYTVVSRSSVGLLDTLRYVRLGGLAAARARLLLLAVLIRRRRRRWQLKQLKFAFKEANQASLNLLPFRKSL